MNLRSESLPPASQAIEHQASRPGDQGRPYRNRRAALALLVLAPTVAELALGSTPIHLAYLLLLWLPIYGAGVLLIREVVVRTGRGWASIGILTAWLLVLLTRKYAATSAVST